MDQERQSALLQVKLGALVRNAFGVTGGAPSPFPGGAALAAGDALYALVDEAPRSIGPALALARRHDAPLQLLAGDGAGRLATQAAAFTDAASVWSVVGTDLRPAAPEPLPEPPAPPDAPELAALMAAAGLDVVVEHGRIAGELRGLELARVVAPPEGGLPALEVGVGQADRELTAMLHGALTPEDALARVIEVVARIRRPGAEPHPLNRLVPERWLRWVLRGAPELAGATTITPAASPRPRGGLRERDVACATATLADGSPAVLVCSVGIDLDLVPVAAEARAALDPGAELVLVVPERDVHPVTQGLAAALRAPARIVAIEGDWRTR